MPAKGTVGITYRQEDMPFSCEGISPDLIINPHAIPSRMTIGHLVECLQSKVCSLDGTEGDASPFTGTTVEETAKRLAELGFHPKGFEVSTQNPGISFFSGSFQFSFWQVLYNGRTGRKLNAQMFVGPTYYQRLKHMVADKMHSRARGPVQILTRQPVEGRSRDGGLRFGEMERDCFIAHGAARFLQERMFDQSDPYSVHVCERCGLMATSSGCNGCGPDARVLRIKIPYAAKLLFQELMVRALHTRWNFLCLAGADALALFLQRR
jgi:DNA-directed RNA polymerase II subunit RPB2